MCMAVLNVEMEARRKIKGEVGTSLWTLDHPVEVQTTSLTNNSNLKYSEQPGGSKIRQSSMQLTEKSKTKHAKESREDSHTATGNEHQVQ